MKILNKLTFTLVGAAMLVGSALAQTPGRVFDYQPADFVDQDYSGAGDVSLEVKTKVNVLPYLYVIGNFGAEWTVQGWGEGTDSRDEELLVYHNESLTLDIEDLGDLQKTSGTNSGAQTIALFGRIRAYNDSTNVELMDSTELPASDFNTFFNPNGPTLGAELSGGKLRLAVTRRIALSAGVGPGTYENVGTLTVIRN